MRRLTLSALALAVLTPALALGKGERHAPAPHPQAPHMQPQHMQVPHMMQPQFFHFAAPPKQSHPNNAKAPHGNAPHAQAAHNNGANAHPAHTNAAKAIRHSASVASPTNGASSLAPGMTPGNTMHFPNENINFPSQNIHFPNGGLNFPSEVSVTNTGLPTMNFPSQASAYPFPTVSNALGASHFPSYVTNLGAAAIVPGSSARSRTIPTAMLATPIGVGGMYRGSYGRHYGYGNRYRSPHYASYRNYTNTSAAQRHLNRLIADLDALQPRLTVTSHHHNVLKSDLMTLNAAGPGPSSAVVMQLASNLSAGMVRRKNPTIDTADLARGLRVVVNGPHLPAGEVHQAIAQSEQILHQGGFSRTDIQSVVADMRAVANHTLPGQGVGMAR